MQLPQVHVPDSQVLVGGAQTSSYSNSRRDGFIRKTAQSITMGYMSRPRKIDSRTSSIYSHGYRDTAPYKYKTSTNYQVKNAPLGLREFTKTLETVEHNPENDEGEALNELLVLVAVMLRPAPHPPCDQQPRA